MSFTIEEDLDLGITAEHKLLPYLQKHFGGNLYKEPARACRWDYRNDTHFFELKTRRVSKNRYPTTMLAVNKVRHPNTVFIFNFTNGVYYIEYDEETFSGFERAFYQRQSNSDFKNRLQEYYYIPVWKLKPLCLLFD